MLGAQSVPAPGPRLVKASPLVDQMHFKFVDISYSGAVNFLLHKAYTPDAIVIWVQIR